MKTNIESAQCSVPRDSRLSNRIIRTLLAEDCPILMALLARTVSRIQKVSIVGCATDGLKALRNASTLQLDLVVTDLHMPGMDGAEVAHLLKQQPNPPIVFVATSDDTPEARARCLAAGVDAFLLKAGNLAPRLLSAIQEFFPDDLGGYDNQPEHLHESLTTVKPGGTCRRRQPLKGISPCHTSFIQFKKINACL